MRKITYPAVSQSHYLSPSPELKPAEILEERCERHNLQIIHLRGSCVCSCPDGCVYRYPSLEKIVAV